MCGHYLLSISFFFPLYCTHSIHFIRNLFSMDFFFFCFRSQLNVFFFFHLSSLILLNVQSPLCDCFEYKVHILCSTHTHVRRGIIMLPQRETIEFNVIYWNYMWPMKKKKKRGKKRSERKIEETTICCLVDFGLGFDRCNSFFCVFCLGSNTTNAYMYVCSRPHDFSELKPSYSAQHPQHHRAPGLISELIVVMNTIRYFSRF